MENFQDSECIENTGEKLDNPSIVKAILHTDCHAPIFVLFLFFPYTLISSNSVLMTTNLFIVTVKGTVTLK